MTLYVLTLIIFSLAAVYLVVLGLTCIFVAERAKAFLLAFASSAGKHYLEIAVRIIVGASMIVQAPWIEYPRPMAIFGWLLVLTSAGLLLIPWRWIHSPSAGYPPLSVT